MTQDMILNPVALSNWYKETTRNKELWKGKMGREHQLWFVLICLAGEERNFDGTIVASQTKLMERMNLNSVDGLNVAIERLVEMGLIEIVDRGSSDFHSNELEDGVRVRAGGHAATYRIRHPEPPSISSSYAFSQQYLEVTDVSPSLFYEVAELSGGHRLPNIDRREAARKELFSLLPPDQPLKSDVVSKEKHLLRFLHLIWWEGIESPRMGPTWMSNLMGMAMSSCHEAIARWKKLNLIIDDKFSMPSWVLTSKDRFRRLMSNLYKRDAERDAAMEGTWMASRFRKAQRRAVMYGKSKFGHVNPKIVAIVTERQEKKGLNGEVPWLDPGELLRAIYDGMEDGGDISLQSAS